MRGIRSWALAIGCAALVVAAAAVVLGADRATGGGKAAARRRRRRSAKETTRDVDRMLREVSSRRIERSIERLASFGTRHTLSSQTDPARGIGAARDWIYAELQRSAARSGGRMRVELQGFIQPVSPRIPQPTRITNVVAALRGTEPASADRMYVVSGHYDSRCSDPDDAVCDAPGANDDASGVAASVRLFAEGPPANETPAEAATRRTTGGENDSAARQLSRYAKEVAESADTDMRVRIVYRRDRYLRGGDHIPFLERRFPAARFTEVNEDYRHQHQDVRVEDGVQYGDLTRFVDYRYTARVARVNGAVLAGLATAPAAPADVRVRTGQLSVDTQLEWAANDEPDLAGYEVVYRDTVEPYWTNRIRVGNVTSYTAQGLTKDNFLFGVRAVDRDGNRSPVSFPRPVP